MKNKIIKAKNFGIILFLVLLFCSCNHGRPCVDLKLTYDLLTLDLIGEPYGATDINAVSGNQGLSIAFNQAGTITVFKWPNPSYYDQVKYMTTRREKERLGALANEGVFTGIYYETDSGNGFFWLRDLEHHQSYNGPRSVVVKTHYSNPAVGLWIDQFDFVSPNADVLRRHYLVVRTAKSQVKRARLIAYSNFAPKVSKISRMPITDWCMDPVGNSTIRWDDDKGLFIQSRQGKDFSTKKKSAVFLAFGFEGKGQHHQAGYDHFCTAKGEDKDAFFAAQKGKLDGSDFAHGKVNSGISYELLKFWGADDAEADFLIAAAKSEKQAIDLIETERQKGFADSLAEEEAHWQKILKDVPLPATDNPAIKNVALRSVISLLLNFCPETGALVDSIATQPPYGEDWPRDGAYLNAALMAAGFNDLVKKHNLFYVQMQSRPGHRLPMVPEGNWATNYFADGVPGFPILWWEIDETGFALWNLFSYFEQTKDTKYLEQVYPTIKLAADFLVKFRDPGTGLTRKAYESDEYVKLKSFRGALSAFTGLKFAVKAAEAMGDNSSKLKWQAREDELEKVITQKFYDPSCRRFVRFEENRGDCAKPGVGWEHAQVLWPTGFFASSDPRAEEFAEKSWNEISPSFSGKRDRGLYEPYSLLSLAKIWKADPAKTELVRSALLWEATVPVTDTGHFGEVWIKINGKVITGQAQPQLWHHALFYLASLEAFGTGQK